MSQTYRIIGLGHFSTYGDGPKGDYIVTVQGDDRELALFHDTSSDYDPPKVGDEFAGDIVKGKRGEWRLKRAGRGAGGGNPGGGGKSPDQQRSIVRQHSQEMALRFIAMTGDAQGMNFGDAKVVSAYLSETVKRLTDWFANDAGGTPAPAQSLPQPSLEQQVPADTEGLGNGSAATPSDERIPF